MKIINYQIFEQMAFKDSLYTDSKNTWIWL